ncbi:MAG: dual specificity protein phosphatase family protein [Candidatus Brocadiaceae bacterium]|nr:dual specificity protein phosphatase family protein [Candidatus Brocadiaceae bacterium]
MPRNFSWLIQGEIAGMAKPIALAEDLEFLKNEGIDAIVSLTEYPLHIALLEEFGFNSKHIPIVDLSPPTLTQIEEFVTYVAKMISSGKRVVVHCDAGIGRTGTMLACYLVCKGYNAETAIEEVRKKRPGSVETVEQEETILKYEETFLKKQDG